MFLISTTLIPFLLILVKLSLKLHKIGQKKPSSLAKTSYLSLPQGDHILHGVCQETSPMVQYPPRKATAASCTGDLDKYTR